MLKASGRRSLASSERGLATARLKPGKRLIGLMLLWAVLIAIGVALTACGGGEPAPTPVPTPRPTVPPATVITFPDENLEAVIRDALFSKPQGEEITAGELAQLTVLPPTERGIADLRGIEYLSNLNMLVLSGNQISDISPLSSLFNLNRVSLDVNRISDISPLVENSGLGPGDAVFLTDNNLDLSEGSEDLENIRKLEERGVSVAR